MYLLNLSVKLYFKPSEDRVFVLNIYLSPNIVPYYKVFNELKYKIKVKYLKEK